MMTTATVAAVRFRVWSPEMVEKLGIWWWEGVSSGAISARFDRVVTKKAVELKAKKEGFKRNPNFERSAVSHLRTPATLPPPPAEEPPPALTRDGQPITLLNATAQHCKWIGGEIVGDVPICGHRTHKLSSWCRFHFSVCFPNAATEA